MAILFAIEGAVSQGVLWGIMTLGVYLTFRILDIADLTVDGSFATGGAISAVLLVAGWNPYLTLLISFFVGMITGLVTGFMNTKFCLLLFSHRLRFTQLTSASWEKQTFLFLVLKPA